MSGLEAFCSQSGHDLRPGLEDEDSEDGKWGAYQSCPEGEVVCGAQARFGRARGVTQANFFCCPLPEDFYDVA